MSESCDLAIVGAGPAGMAAAASAAALGLATVVLDEQSEPGGQIFRGLERVARDHPHRLDILGEDYAAGSELLHAFRSAAVDYRPGATVWQIEEPGQLFYSTAGGSRRLYAKRIVLAVGAMERPMPLPGWTLPGVMSAGAAQIALKSAGVMPAGRIVMIGCGPLMLLLAWQLLRAGAPIAALVDTTPRGARRTAVRELPRALLAPGYLRKGLRFLRALQRSRVPVLRSPESIEIRGDDRVREVVLDASGVARSIAADMVLLHQGVVPNANLGWALRCEHDWSAAQRCFVPRVDAWGTSSRAGVQFAGDCAGIGGAGAAAQAGHLAALEAAHHLGRIDARERDARARAHRRSAAYHLRIRPLLDSLYRPADASIVPPQDDVLVCRCEEVSAGEIRRIVAQGCPGPNQMKAFSRCGMGPCQGRLCGLTVTETIASARGLSPADIGYYRIRPPIKPLLLEELAAVDFD